MNDIWQMTIVGTIVALALTYLGQRLWHQVRHPERNRCGICSCCPAKGRSDPSVAADPSYTPLVNIDDA